VTFPVSTPSAEGIEPAALLDLLDAVDAHPGIEPHGLIIQRHGRRVLDAAWTPHQRGQSRLVYSLSKSFTGAALALAVGDGLLSLDDLVVDHLPEAAVDADERTRRMRIRHIASMSSGHSDETLLHAFLADPTDIVDAFLHLPPENEPGTWFAYNQPPVLALSTVLAHVTGRRLLDQLRERVLDPIGVGDLRWYQYQPGIDLGFSGVYTDLDAIARLGQLHLDDGCFDGRRVLPEGWVAQASSVQIENPQRPEPDWSQGYGFQLWMCQHGYRGDGAFGQYMVVLPEQDTVVAFFSTTEPMQPFLDLLWEGLVPAIDKGCEPDPEGDRAVADRVAGLRLPTAAERLGAAADGAAPATGRFVRPEHGHHHHTITAVEVADGEVVIQEGDDVLWIPIDADWVDVAGHPIAASTAVHDDGGLTVDLAMLATPHRMELGTDPATGTFSATWPLPPLFGLGLEAHLSRMAPPD
jgi:hypothetical protein